MRKQIGFDVITENIGNATEKQILLGRIQKYLDEGWEVLNTHVPLISGGAITIAVTLMKWEELPSTVSSAYLESFDGVDIEVAGKRGPGRPKTVKVNEPDVVPSVTA